MKQDASPYYYTITRPAAQDGKINKNFGILGKNFVQIFLKKI